MLPLEHDQRAKYEECCDSLALCRAKSRRQCGNVARVAGKNAGNACRMWAQRSIAVAIYVVFFNFSSSTTHTFVHQKIFIAHHNFCVCTCGTKTVAAIVGKRVLRRFETLVSHCQLDRNS